MKLNRAIITLLIFLTSCVLLANTLSMSNNGDGTWNVNYTCDEVIAAWQFDVDGDDVVLTGASGGDSGDAGFAIHTGNNTVLAFSLSGDTMGPSSSEGSIMVVLTITGTPTGLSEIIVQDPNANIIDFTYNVCGSCICDECGDERRSFTELNFRTVFGFENQNNKFGIELSLLKTIGAMAIYERLNLLPWNLNLHFGGGYNSILPAIGPLRNSPGGNPFLVGGDKFYHLNSF